MTKPQLIFGDPHTLDRKLVDHMNALEQKISELKAEQRKLYNKLKIARKHYWEHKKQNKVQDT